MAEYIDREAAISILNTAGFWDNEDREVAIACVEQTTAADVAPAKHGLHALRPVSREQVEQVWRGEWLNFYNDFSTAECSKCGEIFEVSPDIAPKEEFFKAFKEFYHFCPSCGTLMTDEAVQIVMDGINKLLESGRQE